MLAPINSVINEAMNSFGLEMAQISLHHGYAKSFTVEIGRIFTIPKLVDWNRIGILNFTRSRLMSGSCKNYGIVPKVWDQYISSYQTELNKSKVSEDM